MHRVKQLLGGRLSLRNYNAQVGETYAMIKALNKLTGLGLPENSVYCIRINQLQAEFCSLTELRNKAYVLFKLYVLNNTVINIFGIIQKRMNHDLHLQRFRGYLSGQ